MTLQVVLDWVLRLTTWPGRADRPQGARAVLVRLIYGAIRAALVAMVENGPIPAVHGRGVGLWRIIDPPAQWPSWEDV